jgi:carbonic anhydrase
MSVVADVTAANERYASEFDKGGLPMPPARKFAVVTCMDARLDPAGFLGLAEGDAHVIRNAGGLVNDETIRSLVISHHLLGTEEAVVIGHTDCGMLTFTNDDLHEKLALSRSASTSSRSPTWPSASARASRRSALTRCSPTPSERGASSMTCVPGGSSRSRTSRGLRRG